MHIVVHTQMKDFDSEQWNSMVVDNNPFMRYEFLHGLELSACVCQQTGWIGSHIAAYSDASQRKLIAAMPCYIKDHSYGEYIFDWAWADAHHRNGLHYYPKLTNAIPFTPASGPRWLVSTSADSTAVSIALLKKALSIVEEKELSSFHSLFLNREQFELMGAQGLSQRHSSQFHWKNQGYTNFDSFLAQMSSKKRKNIKRERRRVIESEVDYEWLSGEQLDSQAVSLMFKFYSRTIAYYGAQSYLNREFFDYLATEFNQQTLFLFAKFNDQVIAGGLYFKSDNTLYGRYWGALNNFHSIHFETCYYQAIEWCIKHGYQKFEAGAQGEHKLARGLEPAQTYSAHWIRHPEFRSAIDGYLAQEKTQIERYTQSLDAHSPFKSEL